MGVDETIKETEYGIRRMKEDAQPFDFYLKGTLVCLKGALDYLLEEYNSKYSVGIGEKDFLDAGRFRDRVNGKNPKAEAFTDEYDREKKKLLADPKCEKLLGTRGSRDIVVHRKQLEKKVAMRAYEDRTMVMNIVTRDAKGNDIGTISPPLQPVPVGSPEVVYFLSDWPNDDVCSLCEYTLGELKKLIGTLRSKFT